MLNWMNRGCRTGREGAHGHRCHIASFSFCQLALDSIKRNEDSYHAGQLTGAENMPQTLDFVNHQQAIAKKMGKEAYLRSLRRRNP